ncbi:MAG: biopolymer transporter ExbD [Deltaproteobacteria bacterium]|nr:biopolymer transporter ExbD [Deltaproteobacteria bacterium]
MAFGSTNGSKRLVSEINVTPLVDVMLVLLIIFMITAPMMSQTLSKTDHEKPIFLKADKKVPYGLVVSVMADIKDSGFDKLGMITQPADRKKNP